MYLIIFNSKTVLNHGIKTMILGENSIIKFVIEIGSLFAKPVLNHKLGRVILG